MVSGLLEFGEDALYVLFLDRLVVVGGNVPQTCHGECVEHAGEAAGVSVQ